MRDRIRRGLTPDRRHERPTYIGEELREIHGTIAAIGLSARKVLAVKVLPDIGGGLLGVSRWIDSSGVREEAGAWILWDEPYELFSFLQPRLRDPVVVTYVGNRPADGRARRVGKVGSASVGFESPSQHGLFRILSAVGGI